MVICALLYIRIDYLTLLTVVTVLVTMVHWSTMTTAWNQLTLIDVANTCLPVSLSTCVYVSILYRYIIKFIMVKYT